MNDAKLKAIANFWPRLGASSCQFRYDDSEKPTVWMAVVEFPTGQWEAAAGHDPLQAAIRVTETLVDGGTCAHCSKPTGFSDDLDEMPLDELVCWYQWDPELDVVRRGCE